MSRRPYDPFSPAGNWATQGRRIHFDTSVEVQVDDPPPDAPPLPATKTPQKPARRPRVRKPRKPAAVELKEALDRLDEAT